MQRSSLETGQGKTASKVRRYVFIGGLSGPRNAEVSVFGSNG